MRRITYFTLLLLMPVFVWAQNSEYYYYTNGEKQSLEPDTERIFIATTRSDILQNVKNTATLQVNELNKDQSVKMLNKDHYWSEVDLGGKLTSTAYKNKIEQIRKADENVLVAPYFKTKTGKTVGLTNYFYVKLNSESDLQLLEKKARETKTEIVMHTENMPLWYVMTITPETGKNALEMANLFYESGMFAQAHPNLKKVRENNVEPQKTEKSNIMKSAGEDPVMDFWNRHITIDEREWAENYANDEYSYMQLSLHGMDIWKAWGEYYNVPDEEDVPKSLRVKVAVISTGIDREHPDLRENMSPLSYDGESFVSPNTHHDVEDYYGATGTSIAGIIGAERNNEIGTAGIASRCQIMDVRLPKELEFSPNWEYMLANAIGWAWRNGAEVMDVMWLISLYDGSIVEDALVEATQLGRNGLGCIITAPLLAEPVNESVAEKLISATSMDFNLSTCGSGDYGVDVVVPDIQGTILSPRPQEYAETNDMTPMNGSASVAGVAAMILTNYRNFSYKEVKELICRNAEKLPDVFHFDFEKEYGAWDDGIGYGVVNAYAACAAAIDYFTDPEPKIVSVSGDWVCEGEPVTFRIQRDARGPLLNMYTQWIDNDSFIRIQGDKRSKTGNFIASGDGYASMSAHILLTGYIINPGTDLSNEPVYTSDPVLIGPWRTDNLAGFETSLFYANRLYWFSVSDPDGRADYFDWIPSDNAVVQQRMYDEKGRNTHVGITINAGTGVLSDFSLTVVTGSRCGEATYTKTGRVINRTAYSAENTLPTVGEGQNKVRVYSASGALLYNGSTDTKFGISTTGLSDGVYIMETIDENGEVTREKVMLKR